MLGIIYILLSFVTGMVICSLIFPKLFDFTKLTYRGKKITLSPVFFVLPLWYVIGTFVMVWITYFTAYLAALCGSQNAILVADAIVMPMCAAFSVWGIIRMKRRDMFSGMSFSMKPGEIILAITTVMFSAFLMCWTLGYRDHALYAGWSIFSDFSVHIGMARSFSIGNNFPTTYSQFAGADVKYHFFFQFLVGNLEALGMRIDVAFNVPSILCLTFVFWLLYTLALKVSGRCAAGVLSILLLAFRSSDAFFDFLIQNDPKITKVSTTEFLRENGDFIGITEHDDWGLWNLNVYCNQRHLAIGLCVILLLVLFVLPCVYEAFARIKAKLAAEDDKLKEDLAIMAIEQQSVLPEESSEQTGGKANESLSFVEKAILAVKYSVLSPEGWLPRSWKKTVTMGMVLGLCCFFNGACVIGCLCVLFLLAWVSDHRLEYAIIAAITVVMTSLTTAFFIDGSVVNFQFVFGFLAKTKTFVGVGEYIMTLCGILPFVLLAALLISDEADRWIWFAFTAPFILAFTVSLTPDLPVNHKYVMMSLMLLDVPAAIVLVKIADIKGILSKAIMCMLLFVLTISGLYDFTMVVKKNDWESNYHLVLRDDNEITLWVEANANAQDIFLSAPYALNEYVYGGAMLFYGWPYFSSSAGYDEKARLELVMKMYATNSVRELLQLVHDNNIRYIVISDEVRENYEVNETLIPFLFQVAGDVRPETDPNYCGSAIFGDTVIYDAKKLNEAIENGYLPTGAVQ